MLKLLILVVSISFLNAEVNEKFVVELIKKSSNKKVEIVDVEVVDKKAVVGADGFYAFFVIINLKIKDKNSTIKQPDVIITNGTYMISQMIDIKKRKAVKSSLSPDFNPKYYKKENLLYGNEDAKHKMVLFSDPQCPFCVDESPFLMDKVKKHPKLFALYYYHLPLEMHPAAKTIVKAVLVAEKKGYKDILKRAYEADIDIRSKDEDVILKVFNEKLKTNITKAEINNPEIINRLESDTIVAKEMFVHGTPSLYLDGVKDNSRSKYEKFIK